MNRDSEPVPLKISLLGPFEVQSAGQTLAPLHSRKEQWLLALLALHHGEVISRTQLAWTLWPDSAEEQALAYLRRSLYLLKRALGAEADRLQSAARGLRLDISGARVDVLAFDAAIRRKDTASLEEAIGLYRGVLLEGCDAEWILEERKEREQAFLQALETLGARALAGGDPEKAPLGRTAPEPAPSGGVVAPGAHRRSRIPHPPTPLVGRAETVYEAQNCLTAARLVTLTGTGGVGKTRIAIQVAEERSEEEEVWFIGLATRTSPEEVAAGVAKALGASEAPDTPMEETLVQALAARSGLLVLDNCEHLLDACAELCSRLLSACPRLRILTTSRQSLGIFGEVVLIIPPLNLPPRLTGRARQNAAMEKGLLSILMEYEAIRLFVIRAQAVLPSFSLTPQNAATVLWICRHLEGIPLALELAAARVKTLSVEQIQARLENRFRLLTGGNRAALPHHQTLRALIDWSYDLLTDPERELLNRLSVFMGGWTLEAVEAVATEEGAGSAEGSAPEVLDLLASLVDKSLVLLDRSEEQVRYRLLETIREYAAEQLEATGESEAIAGRQCHYYRNLIRRLAGELHGAGQKQCLLQFEVEHDNLGRALQWSLTAEDPEIAMVLCSELNNFWIYRGYYREGRAWCERALRRASGGAKTDIRANLLGALGTQAWMQADLQEAYRCHEEALSIRRELGSKGGIATSLERLATVSAQRGDLPKARLLLEEAVTMARETENRKVFLTALVNLGCAAREQGDNARAREAWEEALPLARDYRDYTAYSMTLTNLANLAHAEGNYEQARLLHEESLAVSGETGNRSAAAMARHNLGIVAVAQGDYEQARPLMKEAITDWKDWGNQSLVLIGIEVFTSLIILEADSRSNPGLAPYLLAAKLFGGAERAREALGCPMPPSSRPTYDANCQQLKELLDAAALEAAWNEGRTHTLEQTVASLLESG